MVDRNELGRVNALYAENRNILQAFATLDAGGRIERLTIGDVSLAVGWMAYPSQMTDMIKQQLQERQAAIRAELEGLGLSGDLNELPEEPEPPQEDWETGAQDAAAQQAAPQGAPSPRGRR